MKDKGKRKEMEDETQEKTGRWRSSVAKMSGRGREDGGCVVKDGMYKR